ncbi:GDSL-motif lipase 2 [Theobroma cacao]|uniref:GDSL-motif lipase 2 n=1 Tax=Theobroma cacao TaxID=3641 RepID=A0A061GJU8_THECC|nr:GDSL-motif lipase 2 [Theobroma cacao]
MRRTPKSQEASGKLLSIWGDLQICHKRFSDGRKVPDFIAEYAKLPLIPPYLQPNNHQFTSGVNFASAGAGALTDTNQRKCAEYPTRRIEIRKEDIKVAATEILSNPEIHGLKDVVGAGNLKQRIVKQKIQVAAKIRVSIRSGTVLIIPTSSSLPKNHVALFILGDSLFDSGNNNYIDTIARANFWPYGETFFKYPTGRFSDGRLIPDFIAEYANLPLIQPYLQPGNHQFTYGVNFASAGAGALAETAQGFVIDLKTQLSYFKNVTKMLRQKLGDAEAKTLFSKAVYLINIGANDILSPFTTNSSVFQSLSKEEYVGMVIGNITDTIKEIYKKGGRKFGLSNLGALGCIPGMKVLVPGITGSCFEEATELAKLHNAALSKALQELAIKLEGFKYAKHDIYTSSSERTNNPEKYGFKEAEIACCGSGPYRGIDSCGGIRVVTEYELCADPSEYWFFDSGHLTEKAYKQLAELMWSGTPNITGPYNLKALFEA